MFNRLSLSILVAAIAIVLGLLMLVYHPPGWERFAGSIFAVALTVAVAFGVWVMVTILRSGIR